MELPSLGVLLERGRHCGNSLGVVYVLPCLARSDASMYRTRVRQLSFLVEARTHTVDVFTSGLSCPANRSLDA